MRAKLKCFTAMSRCGSSWREAPGPRGSEGAMKQIPMIAAALVAGFVGGILGARLARTGDQPVVRARNFELVDASGQAIAFWGVDKGQNEVLAFGSRGLASGGV